MVKGLKFLFWNKCKLKYYIITIRLREKKSNLTPISFPVAWVSGLPKGATPDTQATFPEAMILLASTKN